GAHQLFSIRVADTTHLPIADFRAKWVKVAVKKPAFTLVEHVERFGLVGFNRGNRLFKHRLGLRCRSRLGLGKCRASKGYCARKCADRFETHKFPPVTVERPSLR